MLDKGTLKFYSDLSENNERNWFQAHKTDYDRILKGATDFAEQWISGMSKVEPYVSDNNAKKSIFRIYNDVRFSKNKLPYKNHLGMAIGRGGRIAKWAGWYLHIEPGNKSFAGAGKWMPEATELKAIRQEIDYNTDEFLSIVQSPEVVKHFGEPNKEYVLKNAPKDYSIDHPAIEYLKLKCFFFTKSYTDEEVMKEDFIDHVIEDSARLLPFVHFLNRGLEDVLLKQD